MASQGYIIAADFHTRADGIQTMKDVIAEVTSPSLQEEGCQLYHWSQGADDPTLFLLYMEWRDKACFQAHVATAHVKHAEERLKNENILVEPAREWHFRKLLVRVATETHAQLLTCGMADRKQHVIRAPFIHFFVADSKTEGKISRT